MTEDNSQHPRFPPKSVVLGPRTRQLLSGAVWEGADAFPASQAWADDVEQVLSFLECEQRLEAFLATCKSAKTPQHRDACLAEARGAFHLSRHGFRVLQWEPPGEGRKKGEVLVRLAHSPPVFVEIKQPGWQGETFPLRLAERQNLSPEERALRQERIKKDKYLHLEGGAVGSHLAALDVVRRNALPKLTDRCPNLVVIVDDLKVSPVGMPTLAYHVEREFANPGHDPDDPNDVFTYERLGGLLFLNVEVPLGQDVRYLTDFIPNRNAIPACSLPPSVTFELTRMKAATRKLVEQDYAGRSSLIEILRSRNKPWNSIP
jgi:hypothetical protein